ncbi:MAG: DUF4129 domain-containing protein [Anaerolinea sp.]
MNRLTARQTLLILTGILLLFSLILSAGLTGLTLSPGLIYGNQRLNQTEDLTGSLPDATPLLGFFQVVLGLALTLFPVYLVYMLIHPQRRKKLLRYLAVFALFLFLFERLRQAMNNLNPQGFGFSEGESGASQEVLPIPPLADFVANPPSWLVNSVAIFTVILIALTFFSVIWLFFLRRERTRYPLAQVGFEASRALENLQSGADLRETIIECYRRMGTVVAESRGVQRANAVTPHEFIQTLVQQGLPEKPVYRLTQLFEDARYGHLSSTPRQQIEATGCLEEIVAACQRTEQTT